MKRQAFRLGSVLRFYELQKERSEYELHQASRMLQDIEREIDQLGQEIAAVAALCNTHVQALSAAGWLACYRKSEYLNQRLTGARVRRDEQAKVIVKLEEVRKRWAIAEETLLTLKHRVTSSNHDAAAKTHQLLLDETVLRQWLGFDSDTFADS